jgi:hypothetical protein
MMFYSILFIIVLDVKGSLIIISIVETVIDSIFPPIIALFKNWASCGELEDKRLK